MRNVQPSYLRIDLLLIVAVALTHTLMCAFAELMHLTALSTIRFGKLAFQRNNTARGFGQNIDLSFAQFA